MSNYIKEIRSAAARGTAVSAKTALAILHSPAHDFPEIMAAATQMRRNYFGDSIIMCSILNAKSGACPENCKFCAQSVHHKAGIEIYALRSGSQIVKAYKAATSLPINHYGIVTSGESIDEKGIIRICDAIRSFKRKGVEWCASLGSLTIEQFRQLKAAGLKRFHHNLETAESYFPRICTTHSYADRLATLKAARKAGLELCSGGILGMGETIKQRVELAFTLQREKVDAIPLNFLVAVKGTKLEKIPPMKPLDILRCVAMFRMTNPRAEIKVCAGRIHLRDLQSMIFYAGATGIMIGDLLTVAGRDVKKDLQMLEDLEAKEKN
ncbi:MAG: biotin synthase BioB [Lentisphaerae bacterium RIFOXYA12_FULL_48_11]|nr:MAG: biotin synthase BioB [Lentisphaerae bacterium RIFOXYA12_FULL_48_11]